MRNKGIGKVANDWNWSRTDVIDVLLSFNLTAILDLFNLPHLSFFIFMFAEPLL
jgi:hypothetical protein